MEKRLDIIQLICWVLLTILAVVNQDIGEFCAWLLLSITQWELIDVKQRLEASKIKYWTIVEDKSC
jgi:hypothetical protein